MSEKFVLSEQEHALNLSLLQERRNKILDDTERRIMECEAEEKKLLAQADEKLKELKDYKFKVQQAFATRRNEIREVAQKHVDVVEAQIKKMGGKA
jgi:vacuolar-type H+-ATPase subunit H